MPLHVQHSDSIGEMINNTLLANIRQQGKKKREREIVDLVSLWVLWNIQILQRLMLHVYFDSGSSI